MSQTWRDNQISPYPATGFPRLSMTTRKKQWRLTLSTVFSTTTYQMRTDRYLRKASTILKFLFLSTFSMWMRRNPKGNASAANRMSNSMRPKGVSQLHQPGCKALVMKPISTGLYPRPPRRSIPSNSQCARMQGL